LKAAEFIQVSANPDCAPRDPARTPRAKPAFCTRRSRSRSLHPKADPQSEAGVRFRELLNPLEPALLLVAIPLAAKNLAMFRRRYQLNQSALPGQERSQCG
jgi:hypothetical protein